jgi:hypothetical protein
MEFEFCLEEHEKEIRDFEEDQRPLFPEEGMECPVRNCDTSHFSRYGQLLDHWINIHKDKRRLFKCKSCKQTFKSRANVRKHVGTSHRNDNIDGLWVEIYVNNRQYRSPGTTVLPRRLTVTDEREREKKRKRTGGAEKTSGGMRKESPVFRGAGHQD